MFIKQTLREFIDNPMGRGSNAIASRALIKSDLNTRLDVVMKHKKIAYVIYRTKDKQSFYFHFKIPSESPTRENTYDVVLKFTVPEDSPDISRDKSIKRYEMTFFSNSPSFTYTYAYASNLYGLLISSLESKFDRIVLKSPPITRNPGEIINYEKTIYFAMRYLELNQNLLQKTIIEGESKLFSEQSFVNSIRKTAKIELEIALAKRQEQKDKKKKEVHNPRAKPQTTTTKEKVTTKTKMSKVSSETRITAKKKIKPSHTTRKRT